MHSGPCHRPFSSADRPASLRRENDAMRPGPTFRVLSLAGLLTVAAFAFAQDKDVPKGKAEPAPRVVVPPLARGAAPQTQKINELLAKAWAENKFRPSARAKDYEFL